MTLAITLASLLVIAAWEAAQPRRQLEFLASRRRLGNLGIWIANIVLAALIFPPRPALLTWPIADPALSFVTTFLFLDLFSYGIHRGPSTLCPGSGACMLFITRTRSSRTPPSTPPKPSGNTA